jgi:uncharacterized protein YfaS (alpha-2-macroglobulin family)
MSRFYPDLLVQRLGLEKDGAQAALLPKMVRDGVARLARFQHEETGGWGWWENDKDDGFMTAYVLVGLSAAKAQGYPIEDDLIDKGVGAGAKMVPQIPIRERPCLLYALAEAGYDDSETNLLHAPFRYSKVRTGLDPVKLPADALAYLVLLGKRIGADYRPFYAELQRRAVVEGRLIHWQANRKGEFDYQCSDRMATALALRVFLALDPADSRIPAALRWLMQSRTDGYFGDTRDTAWVLVALCDYLRLHPEEKGSPSGTVAVRLNDVVLKTIDLATDARGEPEIVLDLPTKELRPGRNTFQVTRESGSGTIFYAGALRQTVSAPAGAELAPVVSGGVTVKREVLRVLPRKVGDDAWRLATEPVADGRFQQGDRLRVRLTITAERDASYVVIEDAFPSGAEVTERGTAEEEVTEGGWGFWYDHVDVRDDRIAFFAHSLPTGTHVIEYNLRAQTPGTCRTLPAEVTGMYDAALHSSSAGTRIEVQP